MSVSPSVRPTRVDGSPGAAPFFTLDHCSVVFGGLSAVKDVSFALERGSLVGLIGPNGAGKTTIFNLATGVYVPTRGRILFNGRQIAGPRSLREMPAGEELPATGDGKSARMESWSRRDIARAGICRTFQNIRLFQGLTVLENVLVASNWQMRQSIASAMLRTSGYYRAEAQARDYAYELLGVLKLDSYAEMLSRNLPYGAQRRLEIARALATKPQLLLLDEPAAGMNPHESAELMEMIRDVRNQFSLTILLIEHDMKVVMGMCERVLVLENGSMLAEGTPSQIQANPRVIGAYLGEAD